MLIPISQQINIDERVLIAGIFVQMAQDAGYTKKLLLSDINKVWKYYSDINTKVSKRPKDASRYTVDD